MRAAGNYAPLKPEDSHEVLHKDSSHGAGDFSSLNQGATQAESRIGGATSNARASAHSTSPIKAPCSRPQTAKYKTGQVLHGDVRHADAVPVPRSSAYPQAMNRINSAREISVGVVRGRSLRSGRNSNLVTNPSFGNLRNDRSAAKAVVTMNEKHSLKTIQGVAFIDGESHEFSLGGTTQKMKSIRSRSRKRVRPPTTSTQEIAASEAIQERIRALKASKKISHSYLSNSRSASKLQNMVEEYKRKSASPGDRHQYDHAMVDPVLKHA